MFLHNYPDHLKPLSPEDYTRPCKNLSDATVGQHVRHIIEMFQCLENGYHGGIVNYENRNRDRQLEQDKESALRQLQEIHSGLHKPDKALILEGMYHNDAVNVMQFPTNYYREIVYNLEHTIHHMALIRVGLQEIIQIELPENYGVAASTVKHRKTCAQ